MTDEPKTGAGGRMLTVAAWTVLVLGLWLWGREITDVPEGAARAGRPGAMTAVGLPDSYDPLPGAARPVRVEMPSLGIRAPVIPRGLDRQGAVDPPPYDQPGTVGWWVDGTRPGAGGPGLLVGHVDTRSKPAVFYGLSSVQPGDEVRVVRDDGTVAEFTVEAVEVHERKSFDPHKVYGPRVPGRAELRLVTCGGTYDKAAKAYTANVVVSAYLTGARNLGGGS
ncbi:class F sortase [Streptomyces sp. NPDC012888]|uniref:class F sortase n=1 Tax=Streptomyces sp. NPDC012888 TaxID=3364855 RepID=UPI00368500BA